MAEDGKPWADKNIREKASDIVDYVSGGAILLGIVAFLVVVVVDETRWTFTTVTPSRVCAKGQRSNCLIRMPGRVKFVGGSWFNVTVDRAPYLREATLSHGPAPAVGSVVVLEDWNGRLVSVFDPARGRRHAAQWPNPKQDLLEAGIALAFLLAVPLIIVFSWLFRVVKRRKAGTVVVTGERAQTS